MATNQEWHYAKNNQKVGPVSAADLKQLAANGELTQTDLIWKEEWTEWKRADSIKGLFPQIDTPVPTSNPVFPAQFKRDATGGMTFSIPSVAGAIGFITVVGKWICIVLAGLFCAVSLGSQMAPAGAQAAGLACFFGICARLFQAEQYAPK
jgi:hypothetical protein